MPLQHVFTYGSLMFEPVWGGVVAGRYRSMPAVLPGYRRQRVRGPWDPQHFEREAITRFLREHPPARR